MPEYIEREALTIENLEKYMTVMEINIKEYGQQVVVAVDDLMYLPAADVVEVRHSEWKQVVFDDGAKSCKCCMACGIFVEPKYNYKYCPGCGAKMDGGCRYDD